MPKRSDKYDHQVVESAWQQAWETVKLNQSDLSRANRPFYNLMMFPYPSAEGLHVGNMYAFTGSDIYGRYMRERGYTVFEPIGLDGFGIHSENYALKVGRHPMDHAAITEKNFYRQLRRIGAMFDWSRTVETYKSEYYHWTQWLFTQMFKHNLAYRTHALVNWCPGCKTVLADEQVINGACERCGNHVEKRSLEQWFFSITAYADKLLENIKSLKWSEKVKIAQENWIGKKEGINITYPVVNQAGVAVGQVTCFTTRPDTNFGATFVTIAPEHPFVTQLLKVTDREKSTSIARYVKKSQEKSPEERAAEGREKTGIDTGLFCINQLNGYRMPLFVSDFVLMEFGTGAVVGVPGHDRRDFEFAKAFGLPVVRVVATKAQTDPITRIEDVLEDEGIMVNSDFLNGMDIHQATVRMMDHLEAKGWGKRVTTFHLRDWLISRQRYWGPPIPMIHCQACAAAGRSWFTSDEAAGYQVTSSGAKFKLGRQHGMDGRSPDSWSSAGWYPVPDADLPVLLPRIADYKPGSDGVAPLAKHEDFINVRCPGCGSQARRETDVSDTFLDSSWYFLRYPSVGLKTADSVPFDRQMTEKWLPVDMYTGGAEHSVLHLLYSRFVTMALKDFGLIGFEEPFENFFAHGLVIKGGAKMSKSKGNVVNPDEYIENYGADALRMYLMFMGPFSQGGDFRDTAMEGMSRWVGRVWRMAREAREKQIPSSSPKVRKALHGVIKKVGLDIEKRLYNTAIAAMMEFTNLVSDEGGIAITDLKEFVKILAPFAPYLSEEIWAQIHGRTSKEFKKEHSVHVQSWPIYDEGLIREESVQIVVQVNGKLRDRLTVSAEDAEDKGKIEKNARESPNVKKYLDAGTVRTVIFVPGKLMNFVVR